jgi:hypothetical protein
MSEFKFACPVCGQHITADASTSGGQIECPTCFRKIVVPQAPASTETKFILSASQVAKPRPTSADAAPLPGIARPSAARRTVSVIGALLVLLCAAGAALYVFRDKVFKSVRPPTALSKLPSNLTWSLDLKNTAFPETKAAGRLHGSSFAPESASLEGGTFSLRQGRGWPPDLGLTILLPGRRIEDFAGKTVEVAPDQGPPVPRVIVRWKDEQQQPGKQEVSSGYALKLAFGQPANGRLPGQLYLCLPDEAKSIVAGTFDATLRKPKAPRPKGPKAKG